MTPCTFKSLIDSTRKAISAFILLCFISTSVNCPVYAQLAPQGMVTRLPVPGVMVGLSPDFSPATLKGITVHPESPFQFDFIVDQGDSNIPLAQKKEAYQKLVKYFLASLTIPEKDLWVNLSPYEKNRIIPNDFGMTVMGREILAQDYLLKQITASIIYPEETLGKKFWNKIYKEAYQKLGRTDIPVNTFNKVWIVPDQAVVYENGNTAYILKSHLKVMLEEDYLSLNKHTAIQLPTRGHVQENSEALSPSTLPSDVGLNMKAPQVNNPTHNLASQVVREIVLPELEKEVNEGKNFALLRQINDSLILATWFKKKLKNSVLGRIYVDKDKVKGIDQDPKNNQEIYQRYLQAYKKGVFNYIKEDYDSLSRQTIPRKYFSGGWNADFAMVVLNRLDSRGLALYRPALNLDKRGRETESVRVDLQETSSGDVKLMQGLEQAMENYFDSGGQLGNDGDSIESVLSASTFYSTSDYYIFILRQRGIDISKFITDTADLKASIKKVVIESGAGPEMMLRIQKAIARFDEDQIDMPDIPENEVRNSFLKGNLSVTPELAADIVSKAVTTVAMSLGTHFGVHQAFIHLGLNHEVIDAVLDLGFSVASGLYMSKWIHDATEKYIKGKIKRNKVRPFLHKVKGITPDMIQRYRDAVKDLVKCFEDQDIETSKLSALRTLLQDVEIALLETGRLSRVTNYLSNVEKMNGTAQNPSVNIESVLIYLLNEINHENHPFFLHLQRSWYESANNWKDEEGWETNVNLKAKDVLLSIIERIEYMDKVYNKILDSKVREKLRSNIFAKEDTIRAQLKGSMGIDIAFYKKIFEDTQLTTPEKRYILICDILDIENKLRMAREALVAGRDVPVYTGGLIQRANALVGILDEKNVIKDEHDIDLIRTRINGVIEQARTTLDGVIKKLLTPAQASSSSLVTAGAVSTKGGIDLNPANQNMVIQGKGNDFIVPSNFNNTDAAQISGFVPIVESIKSIPDLHKILGINSM